ncbi:MAG: SRPBCC domain-containing protein [Acidobacteria bacterium]|nr:SRPBCC domain-containing protein [Acidobacteriota bacterium]
MAVLIDPVRKSVEVPLEPRSAFELFTAHLSRWWPLERHSISGERAETCVFELVAGGDVFELAENSVRIKWGRVDEFEPPRRFLLSWHPGRPPETAQEIEVTFSESGEMTLVDLSHRGWEAAGEEADVLRESYETGWDHVLDRYVELARARARNQSVV